MVLTSLVLGMVLLQQGGVTQADVTVGTGTEVAYEDLVTMNVMISDKNGKVYFDTVNAPPVTLVVGTRDFDVNYLYMAIAEFDKNLVGMKQGGKRTIQIPASSGFKDLLIGEIPRNTDLKFEVMMIDVRKKGEQRSLKIEEVKEGEGDPVKLGDKIEVNYKGSFLNGVQFDSSYERQKQDGSIGPQPLNVEVGVTRLISGFTQGLMGMKLGGKRKITIPYEMAYGPSGRPPVIPPYQSLVFELEMVKISR